MSNYNGQFQDSSANILLPTPHSYANIEGATASQAYVLGQMIVYNNRLCEVISAIASGDTLTIGTNIAYKNVGDIGKQLVATDGTGFYFDVADGKYGFYPSASKVPAEFVPFGGSGIVPNEFYAGYTFGSGTSNYCRFRRSDGTKFELSRAQQTINVDNVFTFILVYEGDFTLTNIMSDMPLNYMSWIHDPTVIAPGQSITWRYNANPNGIIIYY